MEQSPSWEADGSSPSQEIPRILWNPKVHYRTQNSLPSVTILSQIDRVGAPPTHVSYIHFNIIHLSTPASLITNKLHILREEDTSICFD